MIKKFLVLAFALVTLGTVADSAEAFGRRGCGGRRGGTRGGSCGVNQQVGNYQQVGGYSTSGGSCVGGSCRVR